MGEYRIEYTIQRYNIGEGDFEDIGFGSSGSWNDVDAACHMMSSDIQCRGWETEAGMPDPESI